MIKKYIALIMIAVMLLHSLSGCGRGNTLLEAAAFDRCDLCWYTYNGTDGNFYVMSDRNDEKSFLKELSEVSLKEVEDWSPEQISFPIYGLQIDDGNGSTMEFAWSNGYCIAWDGKVYAFDYDFEKLTSAYEWNGIYPFSMIETLPCFRELCLGKEGWVAEFLSPADNPMLTGGKEVTAPEGISMELTDVTETAIHVKLTNNGTEEWCFGEDYSIQVCLGENWYRVPEVPGRWGINAIAIILPTGKTMQESYDMRRFGELPQGKYRLVKDGMIAEFEITE